MAMPTPILVVVALSFMLAGMLLAYETGRSAELPACQECPHCRERRRERERRAEEAAAEAARFAHALGMPAIPGPEPLVPASVEVGNAAAPANAQAHALRRILVAYDGSEAARRALELALALAASLQVTLAVVSVVPRRIGRMPIDPLDNAETHARELLEAKELAAQQGVAVELAAPVGEPARTIELAAECGGFDAVLLGARQVPRWVRWLRGSVTAHVADHCAKTVIVVR